MYPVNLEVIKTHQEELHRQAAARRLVRSLEGPHSRSGKILIAISQNPFISGRKTEQAARKIQ